MEYYKEKYFTPEVRILYMFNKRSILTGSATIDNLQVEASYDEVSYDND